MKRFIIIVLDSLGVGALPDAAEYNSVGAHTSVSYTHLDVYKRQAQ